jgi:hypothetical protein
MELISLDELRKQFGKNKYIPAKYEREILLTLSQYPELKETTINFMLALKASVPYGTKPTFASCFKPKAKREYTVTFLEFADEPENSALMKNLTPQMRTGVIAHELVHVIQYCNCNPLSLLRMLALYVTPYKKKIERGADKGAIKHGFGEELLAHAQYLRKIPGYTEKRPELNTDYLQPREIRYYIDHPEELKSAS